MDKYIILHDFYSKNKIYVNTTMIVTIENNENFTTINLFNKEIMVEETVDKVLSMLNKGFKFNL